MSWSRERFTCLHVYANTVSAAVMPLVAGYGGGTDNIALFLFISGFRSLDMMCLGGVCVCVCVCVCVHVFSLLIVLSVSWIYGLITSIIFEKFLAIIS